MARNLTSRAILATLAGTVLGLASGGAQAAVALCAPMTRGQPFEAGSELEARRGALQDWLKLAARYGEGYTRYQIAFDRNLSCERVASGAFRCQASGRPCTISQVPHPELPVLHRSPRASAPGGPAVPSVQVGAPQSN